MQLELPRLRVRHRNMEFEVKTLFTVVELVELYLKSRAGEYKYMAADGPTWICLC